MLNVDIIYIIINTSLLGIFYYAGRNIEKGKRYWDNALICVIAFTLALGLRYGRGDDYFHYIDLYVHGYDEGTQVVFTWINAILKSLGVGKYYFFLFYNLLEIVCSMIFLMRYKKYAKYLFPVFLIATIHHDEYQIRLALGFSFIFLFLDSVFSITHVDKALVTSSNRKKILLSVLYFTLAYSIHSVCGYMLVVMILIYVFYQRTIPLYISIPALLFSAYFFSDWFDLSWLNPVLSQFVGDDTRIQTYIENREIWFSASAMNDIYQRNAIVLFFEMLGTISLYILGSKAINKYVHRADAYAMYNYFVIGTILQNAFRELELLNRIGYNFQLFWFFPLTMVIYHLKPILKIRYNKDSSTSLIYIKSLLHNQKFYKYVALFLIWYVYDYLKYLFMRGDMTKFLWDI